MVLLTTPQIDFLAKKHPAIQRAYNNGFKAEFTRLHIPHFMKWTPKLTEQRGRCILAGRRKASEAYAFIQRQKGQLTKAL